MRNLEERMKEIRKGGPDYWDKIGARASWGRLALSWGHGEPQKDTLKRMLMVTLSAGPQRLPNAPAGEGQCCGKLLT